MEEQRAHLSLKRYYQTFVEATNEGIAKYGRSDEIVLHRPTTAANILNDLIWAELVNRLDGVNPVFDPKKNLRFLKVAGRPPIHLWLKKTDFGFHSSNFPTDHSTEFLEKGQILLFPNAVTLMLGYVLSDDHKHSERVSITPPCGRTGKPAWWIDIRNPANVIGMRCIGANSVQVLVTRSSQQRELKA